MDSLTPFARTVALGYRSLEGGVRCMSLYCAEGSVDADLSSGQLNDLLCSSLARWESGAAYRRPPTERMHSRAGDLTRAAWHYLGPPEGYSSRAGHPHPMRTAQLEQMFPDVPLDLFRVHNWRADVVTLGEAPAEFIREQSEGKLDFAWPRR